MSGRPSISSTILCERSPCATAPSTRPASAIGWVRSEISRFTDSTKPCHAPPTEPSEIRCAIRPSRPTTRLARSSSLARLALSSMQSLNASAISPSIPERPRGRRALKSPRRKARSAARSRLWPSVFDSRAREMVGMVTLLQDSPWFVPTLLGYLTPGIISYRSSNRTYGALA